MRMEESNQVRVKMSRFTKVNLSHIQKTAISSNNHPNKKTRKSIGISNSKRVIEKIVQAMIILISLKDSQ